jgi:hypothetical protein
VIRDDGVDLLLRAAVVDVTRRAKDLPLAG